MNTICYWDVDAGEQRERPASPEEEIEIEARRVAPPTEQDFVLALEAMYDTKAQERQYDNRLTCAIRAGYAGPFQAEGTAFAIWMDTCNATAYAIMADVLGNVIPMPTITELLTAMPTMEWPT